MKKVYCELSVISHTVTPSLLHCNEENAKANVNWLLIAFCFRQKLEVWDFTVSRKLETLDGRNGQTLNAAPYGRPHNNDI